MSTVAVIPGVSGIVAPSTRIAVSSIATVTGKTKLCGWPGAADSGGVAGRGGVGERALRLLFVDRRGGDGDDLAVQRAEAGEREGVELDRDLLADA